MVRPSLLDRRSLPPAARRPRRNLRPAVRPLEGRQLLTGGPSATMTQTATFPDLESNPNLSDQALLYFSATMGTLTEVDVVTSGAFTTQLAAENLGASGGPVAGTTGENLSINVPTGTIPVVIPSVSQSFNATGFDGTLDDGGTSGQTLSPITSRSAPQTTVLTSRAAMNAFTGHFRMPISVTAQATGNVASASGDVSGTFKTQTSATITVIYHYLPNLPGPAPSPGGSVSSSSGGGVNLAPLTSANGVQAGSGHSASSSAHAGRHHAGKHARPPHAHPHVVLRHGPRQPGHLHPLGRGSSLSA